MPAEWGTEPLPADVKTLGAFDFFALWSSLGVGLLVLVAGALLVPGLGLYEAFAVSLLGSVIGSLLLASAGILGSKFGIPTMVSLRAVLGVNGSYIATGLNVLQLVGWTAFELMIMAQAAESLTGRFFGIFTSILWLGIFGVFCCLLALGGPLVVVRKWLERFAIWLVYLSTVWITYQLIIHPNSLEGIMRAGDGSMPFLKALDLVIAMPVSWWPLISDYNRFARTNRAGVVGTTLGFTVTNTWFYVLGAALVVIAGARDVISSMLSLAFGTLALLLILIDESDNAFADIYSSAVSLQNIRPKARQAKFTISITVISAAVGSILLFSPGVAALQYELFLLLIGGFFVPLLGVFFSDTILISRTNYKLAQFYEAAPKIRSGTILAWGLGLAAYLIIANYYPQLGASIPSFLIAMISNYLLQLRKL